eukprot:1156449-Pelagomonas_calceolata.AAC.11
MKWQAVQPCVEQARAVSSAEKFCGSSTPQERHQDLPFQIARRGCIGGCAVDDHAVGDVGGGEGGAEGLHAQKAESSSGMAVGPRTDG